MSNTFEQVIFEVKDRIAVITLNRPQKLNALTATMDRELLAAFNECQGNDGIRAVVITGAGRGFCAGRDLGELKEKTKAPSAGPGKLLATPVAAARVPRLLIDTVEKPTIAAVNGPCAGAGYCMALGCDIRIASQNARFVHAYGPRSLVAAGETWLLPRIVGLGPAMYHIMSGEDITAEEALRLNLVSRVVPADRLLEEATRLAATLASRSPTTMKFTKKAIYKGLSHDFNSAMEYVAYARALESFVERPSTQSE